MQDPVQKITELQQQLQKITDQQWELIQANKKYEKVFSLVTHEFKNLLTSADGYNRLLHQQLLAENRHDLDEILTSGIHIHEKLFNLVDQLLKMWMVEKQLLKPDYKVLDLRTDILEPLERQLKEPLQANKMILKKSLPAGKLILIADENMLEIIMRNLLENAVKYGVHDTRIYLTIKQDKKNLEVSLRNQVSGLAADFCDNIFQRIQEFKSRGQQGGLGIGLYNVKNLIDLHHGEISCHWAKRDWLEFSFRLPLNL
jgi:two-component system sensor histidine kinase/response regulator